VKQKRFVWNSLVLVITGAMALLACAPPQPQLTPTEAPLQSSPLAPATLIAPTQSVPPDQSQAQSVDLSTTPIVSQTGAVVYLSPSAGATWVLPQTAIALRYNSDVMADALQPSQFQVVGSQSGPHAGTVTLSDDQRTIIFKPAAPFSAGESVQLSFAGGVLGTDGEPFGSVDYSFTVTPNSHPSMQPIATRTPQP
jgi:hypothetical protein